MFDRTEEAERFLVATKKARRHMQLKMRDLKSQTKEAILYKNSIPAVLIDRHMRPISVTTDYLIGAHRALEVWFEIYEEADKIWQKEAGIGHHARFPEDEEDEQ